MSSQFLNKLSDPFIGCEGGNVESPVWVCGLESGDNFDIDSAMTHDKEFYKNHGFKVRCWNEKYIKKYPNYMDWRFQRNVSKLFEALVDSKPVDPKYLFCEHGLTLSLNLYPLKASNDKAWRDGHADFTGVDKEAYRFQCFNHRFPKLRKLVSVFKPQIIICSGVTRKRDFIMAFCSNLDNARYERNNGFDQFVFKKTTLVIAPHFSRGVGGRIKQVIDQLCGEKIKKKLLALLKGSSHDYEKTESFQKKGP